MSETPCVTSSPQLPILSPRKKRTIRSILNQKHGNEFRTQPDPIDEKQTEAIQLIEKELVRKMLIRDDIVRKKFNSLSGFVNDKKLLSILRSTQTLNSAWHENMSVFITGQLKLSRRNTKSSIVNHVVKDIKEFSRLRRQNVFRAYSLLSSNTVQGVVLKSGGKNKEDPLFVVKTPIDGKEDSIPHEAMVGLMLNTIRNKIPNFMYTYSYTTCSPPVLEGKEVDLFCDHDSSSSVAIFEFIQNSEDLGSFILSHETNDVENVLEQISYALSYANMELGFVHGDLHPGNVLVRTFDHEIPIPPRSEGKTSKYIPFIIDYGYSTVTVDGIDFFSPNNPISDHIGLDYLPSWAGDVDMYHLLMYLAEQMADLVMQQNNEYKEKLDMLNKLYEQMKYPEITGYTMREALENSWRAKPSDVDDYDVDGSGEFFTARDDNYSNENWLNYWYYFKPKQQLTRSQVPKPGNLWYGIVTNCDFEDSVVVPGSPSVNSLADFWYLVYGTTLNIPDKDQLEELTSRLFRRYSVSDLLKADLGAIDQRIYDLTSNSQIDLLGNYDYEMWKELTLENEKMASILKDIKLLNTIVEAIKTDPKFSKSFDRDSLTRMDAFNKYRITTGEEIKSFSDSLVEEAKRLGLYEQIISSDNPSYFWTKDNIDNIVLALEV